MRNKKTTVKSIWLKVTRQEVTEDEQMAKIEQLELQIQEAGELLKYLTVYIPMVVIPRFKHDRGQSYYGFLAQFAQKHIKSCDQNIGQWQPILDATKNLDDGTTMFKV